MVYGDRTLGGSRFISTKPLFKRQGDDKDAQYSRQVLSYGYCFPWLECIVKE